MYAYVYICVCVHVYVNIYIYIYMYVYMYIHIYWCVFVCMWYCVNNVKLLSSVHVPFWAVQHQRQVVQFAFLSLLEHPHSLQETTAQQINFMPTGNFKSNISHLDSQTLVALNILNLFSQLFKTLTGNQTGEVGSA